MIPLQKKKKKKKKKKNWRRRFAALQRVHYHARLFRFVTVPGWRLFEIKSAIFFEFQDMIVEFL